MEQVASYHLPPQTGAGFTMDAGQVLRIIDPEGEQVADVAAFAREDRREMLSTKRTIDYSGRIYATTGSLLYSNRSRVLFTVVADTAGRHGLLLPPCSPEMFKIMYGAASHPSCLVNLAEGLAPFGIGVDEITETLNCFMNVEVSPDGELTIGVPASRAGDYVDLRAEMDLFIGLTACSAEKTNNGSLKPIDALIFGAG
jgi:uncharacterized protein YcgI (DUF1989 family)